MDIVQRTVLRSLLNKECWAEFQDLVTPEAFSNMDSRMLHKHMGKLHDQHVGDLTVDDLRLEVTSIYRDAEGKQTDLNFIIDELADTMPQDQSNLRGFVQEYLQREICMEGAKYVASNHNSDDFSVERALDFFTRAADIGSTIDAEVLDFSEAGNIGSDASRSLVTSLGISSQLDGILDGGVGAGELLVYLAPPARGKTSMLWASAAAAAKQGRGVLGITLEISARKCVRRVDQFLTGFTRDELIINPVVTGHQRKDLDGKLYIKDWSYTGINVDDIKALVCRMRSRGQDVDYLMVDYLELVKPLVSNRQAERFNWSKTTQDLRALAVDLQVPVVTAWQVNRSGSDAHVLSERDISECWDVVKHADIILGLNQNPAERDEKILRVNVIKQRESTARPQVYLHCDLDRMVIRDAPEAPDGVEEITERAVGSKADSASV